MSGPSVAVRRRRREQVARFSSHVAFSGGGRSTLRELARALFAGDILRGEAIPVRRVRAAARELIALEAQQDAFEDWTRDRGMGPEHGHKFALDEWRLASTSAEARLLRDEGWVWRPFVRADFMRPMVRFHGGGWPGKQAREWPGDRRAPMGRSLARLGRRVLEALEGQPDECKGCEGGTQRRRISFSDDEEHGIAMRTCVDGGWNTVTNRRLMVVAAHRSCPDCHGTGDNLRGVLPEVVETTQDEHKAERRSARQPARAHGLSNFVDVVVTFDGPRASFPGFGPPSGSE